MRATTRFAINVFQNDQDAFDELLISAMLDTVDAAMVGKIAAVNVGVGGSATIDFQNIPQGFAHLGLKLSLRDTGAVNVARYGVRFNNDSAANYAGHYLENAAGVASPGFLGAVTSLNAPVYAGASAPANMFSASEFVVFDYANAARVKELKGIYGAHFGSASGSGYAGVWGGYWTAAAINRITIIAGSTLFAQGSSAVLYGMP